MYATVYTIILDSYYNKCNCLQVFAMSIINSKFAFLYWLLVLHNAHAHMQLYYGVDNFCQTFQHHMEGLVGICNCNVCSCVQLFISVNPFAKVFQCHMCISSNPRATWHHHTSVPSCSYPPPPPPPWHCHTPPPPHSLNGAPIHPHQTVKWAGVHRRYQCKDKTETDNGYFVRLKKCFTKLRPILLSLGGV